jgi:hypothetical protein
MQYTIPYIKGLFQLQRVQHCLCSKLIGMPSRCGTGLYMPVLGAL